MQTQLKTKMTERVGSVENEMSQFKTRLDKVEMRLDGLEQRMTRVEDKLDKLIDKVDSITEKLDDKISETNRHAQILTGTVAGALIVLVFTFLK